MAVTRVEGGLSGNIYAFPFGDLSQITDGVTTIAETAIQAVRPVPIRSRLLGLQVYSQQTVGANQFSLVLGSGSPTVANRLIVLSTAPATGVSTFFQTVADSKTTGTLENAHFDIRVDDLLILPSQVITKGSILTVRLVMPISSAVTLSLVCLMMTDVKEKDVAAQ